MAVLKAPATGARGPALTRTAAVVDAEERGVRTTVAAIARGFGPDYFVQNALAGTFPHELWRALAEGGFAGINVAESDGGPGGSLGHLAAVAEEIARAGCPLMTLVVSPGVCAPLLSRFASAGQRARWLAPIGSGDLRMAFALTEADAGSNTRRLRTRAHRSGSGWVLRGEKTFISGIGDAGAVLVVARTDEPVDEFPAFSLFVVDTDHPRVRLSPLAMHVLAAERQYVVHLDDVEVSEEHLVGSPGQGLRQLFHGLNPERIVSAATCIGLGQYCLDRALTYARTRSVWQGPIGAHQAIAHPLAEVHVALSSARLVQREALAQHALGQHSGAVANMAKLVAADAVQKAFEVAMRTHGGNGLTHEYLIGHLWGLVSMYGIAPVSREMTLNHIASHELGLPRSY